MDKDNKNIPTLGVAVLGLGTVGSSVVKIILNEADDLASRIGAKLELKGIAVKNKDKERGFKTELGKIAHKLITEDSKSLISRDDVDIVIELIGGLKPAESLVKLALEQGKSVVTGNKVLIADKLTSLAKIADNSKADLYYEAAVAGAIPLVKPLQQSLAGDVVNKVMGIVNGTTNFILSSMEENGTTFDDALAEATRLGYAEKPDPSADTEGYDAQAKTAILASIAFHTTVTVDQVAREGISKITSEDFTSAKSLGYTIKLLSLCERTKKGIFTRVCPVWLPTSHPLASVRGPYNAIAVESKYAGRLMFYGQGAGGDPTASAVMGDVVMAARNKVILGRGPKLSQYAKFKHLEADKYESQFYIALLVKDIPGVLASIAGIFANDNISIATVNQRVSPDGRAHLSLTIHKTTEVALKEALKKTKKLSAVIKVESVYHVESN